MILLLDNYDSFTYNLLHYLSELGKEVIIALQRLGIEVVAVDRYADAPGHQVAHRAHVINMTDGAALAALHEAGRGFELSRPNALSVKGWVDRSAQLINNRRSSFQQQAGDVGLSIGGRIVQGHPARPIRAQRQGWIGGQHFLNGDDIAERCV